MPVILICLVVLSLICFIISCGVRITISWLVGRKYKIFLKIGRFGWPYLKLRDIYISKNDFNIYIDEIGITSSFLNSELTKLITLVVKDVRINKDIIKNTIRTIENEESSFDFRNKKIPNFINTFAQFMAVHIYNVSANFLHSETPGCLIHATAKELHFDGSILKNAKSLFVTLNVLEASTRILRHAENKHETCLAEINFGIFIETILVAKGPLSVENLDVKIPKTGAIISDDFTYLNLDGKNYGKSVKKTNDDVIQRLLPIIPKNFSLRIDDTSFKSSNSNKIDYNSALKNLLFNYRSVNAEENEDSHILFNFHLSDLKLLNKREKIIYLKSLNIDAKHKNFIVNLYFQLNSLLLTYNHKILHQWLWTNFLKNRKLSIRKNQQENDTIFMGILKKLSINICAEFSQFSSVIKLPGHDFSIGFNHVRLMLDQAPESRGSIYNNHFLKLLLNDRHWQLEILLESYWWSFKEWNQDSTIPKKMHIWGTPIYLGMVLIKIATCQNGEMKIASLLDTVQFEWSLEFTECVLLAIKCFKEYKFKFNSIKNENRGGKMDNLSLNLAITQFNSFFQSQNNEYFVFCLNSIELIKKQLSTIIQCEELKVFSVYNSGGYYCCIRTEDISNYKVTIKNTNLNILNKNSKLTTILNIDEMTTFWSTNFHLKSLLLFRDMVIFIDALKEEFLLNKKPKSNLIICYHLNILNYLIFNIEISKRHSAKVTFDKLNINTNNNSNNNPILFNNNLLIISIDEADIFTIKGINLERIYDNELIREERMDNDFKLDWNKTWSLSIDLFRAVFPYEHNYADAIQNEFLSIFKWLKIIHNYKKNHDGPLPSDLLINVKEFLFEIGDDPFEVKLRDNFELLEDEYNESLKRHKMLKDKVSELCKSQLYFPAGKVEELYASLKKKNAEIYIQRSKQMLKAAPPRTRLLAWSMTKMELMLLIDPTIYGKNNVIKAMKVIDSDSSWPEENLDFSTLWCRIISFRCKEWKVQLRDFPQPLLDIKKCYICGQLIGSEQVSPKRATRSVIVDLGEPFEPFIVERGMLPLKFYYDLNCEIESYSYAFGPCWEPVIAQCNLSLEKILAPSRDPSPPLSFWDKMRLLLHGRLTMLVQQLTVLLHASLDPYNTTEEMELTWNQVVMDWTNGKFVYKGDLNIFVRTASKYDDCQLLHMPNLKLILEIQWICLGDPNDHHNVIYCAPDKVPEYSSNQVHDSFRAFRSQNVNLSIVLETRPYSNQSPTNNNFDYPMLLLYGSTLRWIENLKLILSGVTRPTKRGKIFNNIRPRKIQLSRHYKKIHLLMGLHKFQVCYWMSFAMQRGCELIGGRLSSSSVCRFDPDCKILEHMLSLVPIDDGLKHRPKAEWSIVYMNSELNDSEIWLKSTLQTDSVYEEMSLRQPVEKCYCLSVAKVSYGRETIVPNREHNVNDKNKDTPTHRLVVYDLRGAWTKSNRNVAFALFDTFIKNNKMKKNLSTEALKGFWKDNNNTTPLKRRNKDAPGTPPNSIQTIQAQDLPSPISKLQSGHAANMLQQLIAEADNKAIVYSDDLSSVTRQQHLQGVQACQEDDVEHKNWQIALVNAQVLLKGCETKGYVIISAAKAEIIQRIHRPVWKDRTLVSKTTWSGILECMQYYATVNAGAENDDGNNENILWLTVDNIQKKESTDISEPGEVPNMVGSGVSVGAVVSDTVGPSNSSQLQRIVSRCKCEFYYAGYGDISVDPEAIGEVPSPPQEDVSPWDRRQTAVDAFTLMHDDLDVCTNSLQYAMLLDIVNNLLLYIEPHRKEALERLARMRFQLQLHSVEDQRRPIQNQQTLVRATMSKLRRLEKETYLISKVLAENPDDDKLKDEMIHLEKLVYECKNQLNSQSEELDMMLSCYKESQLLANSRLATTRSNKPLTIVRANEICFKHAQWRLTENDGQIGIADLVLSNFLYTKNSKSDDSVEHLLELGYLRMTNLLPNEIYKEVLCPSEIQHGMPIEYKKILRIFCREKQPVGGISVKEHFEINLVPLTIGLTKKFYNTMMKFCFPENDSYSDKITDSDFDSPEQKIIINKKTKRTNSDFYVKIVDDVEKMKERAEKNKLFVYIKIPEVPVKVSYKGNKDKNIEDLRDVSLVIPTLEYHNMTWTWLDLLMAIRNDSKRVILSQAIKQKLQIKRNTGSLDENSSPQEEDKARMLFGSRHATENKSMRKGVGVFKFGK